jgi:hypothetical protein
MYNLQAKAFQTRSGIYVHAEGLLENTCMRAKITDTYPGNIFHIIDPGICGGVYLRVAKAGGGILRRAPYSLGG